MLIPRCRYCQQPIVFLYEHVWYGKMFAADRKTGEPHNCKQAWAAINQAFDHSTPKGARQFLHWSLEQQLLKKLKDGPVYQHELGKNQQDILSHLKKALQGSGWVIESYWCCPLGTRIHVREKVYELSHLVRENH